jgi:hypothetical protein
MTRIFTVSNDETMVAMIQNAKRKLVYIAPGISKIVASSIPSKIIEGISATFILDVDAEVCRLGFGEIEGLELLRSIADSHGVPIQHQPGLRIGILIVDDSTMIFSPPPLLIEAGSLQQDKPNAIMLSGSSSEEIEVACGSHEESIPGKAEIGSSGITDEKIEDVKTDLEDNPPKPFNISRIERVFSSKIQFVEFSLENYQLSKMVAQIPADFLGINQDASLSERWRNSFKVFDGIDNLKCEMPNIDDDGKPIDGVMLYNEICVEKEKRSIAKNYLISIPKYGNIIFRKRSKAFDERINRFKNRLEEYTKSVRSLIDKEIEDSKKRLSDQLYLYIKDNPPARLLKMGNSEKDIKLMILNELESKFKIHLDGYKPYFKVLYKDITYNSIHDVEFQNTLKNLKLPINFGELFSEYDAARESSS